MGTLRRMSKSVGTDFEYPVGVELTEGENYRQREGYEVTYLKDDDFPRYQFTVAVSARRVPRLFRRLAGLLPEGVRTICEIPGPPQGDRDVCEVYMSGEVSLDEFLHAFDAHDHMFSHDGMVGYGAMDDGNHSEIFLDDHKLIYFYSTDLDGPENALAECAVPCVQTLKHFSELSHIHNSLASRGLGEDYIEVFEELKTAFNMKWQETKEYD